MRILTDDTLVTYTLEDNTNYRIDILTRNENTHFYFEAWLYHKDYGIKMMMWGEEGISRQDREDFIKCVAENAYAYIEDYRLDFEDRPLFEKG